MTDFTEMYWTPKDQRKERDDYDHERRIRQYGITGSCGVDPSRLYDPDLTYRHECARCWIALQVFDEPVRRDSLKSKLCDECLLFKVRQLEYQRQLIKHPEWRDEWTGSALI